jgi:hypothetical protein
MQTRGGSPSARTISLRSGSRDRSAGHQGCTWEP